MYSLKYIVAIAMATLLNATTTSAAPASMPGQAVNITLPPSIRPAINFTVPVNVTLPASFPIQNQTIPMNLTVSGKGDDIAISVASSWFSRGRKNRRSQRSQLH